MTSVHSVTSHTHDADKFAVEAIKIRTEIMNAADANRGKPGQILADKLLHYPVQVRAATGQHESLKRSIRRVKRGQAPKEPTSINDIPHPLPNDYTTTNNF
ncbi:uncharacterized protein LOC132715654 [Ruditapes philippinarum]|uniref:uncharacterized protein LOC132715654 n=1 Tax=Ruditapes philippinarum TaxID=129788 RepID=UPI00295B5A22|nr:uncharacterized protein LOC132715654 [Ruditapes philippinarum]